ncbi:uncharacterized protein EI97DRAFT_456944 [Westerdykella ornata]|uniref:Anaphase-promoting complex subunit 2 n=1 Tax=Westerdykella ornata TaxID=318751 RepID=A0A6A6JPI3_WESOR|nr:uncharacterized protein EI97DRAFT_456944 [Westerdykella ornata]KAF2278560.1 hypothetical protein EI97DRAFT_456944 [Westerdykella ornata]
MDHKSVVFASVFPVPSLSHTTPTPIATPVLGYASFGPSFEGPAADTAGAQQRAVRRNVAWSTATRFLSLPKTQIAADASFEVRNRAQRTPDVEEALEYLLVGEGRSEDEREQGIVEWFANEATLHFAAVVRPRVAALWEKEVHLSQACEVLDQTQRILERAQNLYFQPFADHLLPFLHRHAAASSSSTVRHYEFAEPRRPSEADIARQRFQREIHAAFTYCVSARRFTKTLSYALYDMGCAVFRVYIRQEAGSPQAKFDNISDSRRRMVSLLQGLERVGLGGDNAQRAFAHAMDKLMGSFIDSHYTKVDWYSRKSVVPHLRMFIRDGFCPLAELVLECLKCQPSSIDAKELQVWQDMALGRLGRARVEDLFDYVIRWDKSLGAICDLKEYLKLPGAKQHLTSNFSQQVSRRLLHPGATTTFILNVYISVIRAFHELEPKGVLLERVARPIRRYLREREDTGRIIIASLLVDPNDGGSSAKTAAGVEISYEIAKEMAKPLSNFSSADADDELDYGDMNWQPLPSDASPEYKKSKGEDVIWFLLSLWDRDDFISELKNILGDHLLRCQDPEYEKEIRLLELIKVRLGDEKLQACEVMLRDVLDSKRINAATRINEEKEKVLKTPEKRAPRTPENAGPRTPRTRRAAAAAAAAAEAASASTQQKHAAPAPKLNAQILSSFFWPPLRDDEFLVPPQIQALQKEYEVRFERIKGMRKLRWMNALGDGSITLELEDRMEEFDHLTPWQISVICAFQEGGEEGGEGDGGFGKSSSTRNSSGGKNKSTGTAGEGHAGKKSVTRTAEQLEEMLQMDEDLVQQALAFWTSKSILRETEPESGIYEVIENLSSSSSSSTAKTPGSASKPTTSSSTAAATATEAGAVRSQASIFASKKEIYQSFVIGMLTNQGNAPVSRILMMMRMVLPGGFPYGEEELRVLLEEMVEEGRVVGFVGGVFGVKGN